MKNDTLKKLKAMRLPAFAEAYEKQIGLEAVNFGDRATSARTFSHTLTAKQPHRHGGQPHL